MIRLVAICCSLGGLMLVSGDIAAQQDIAPQQHIASQQQQYIAAQQGSAAKQRFAAQQGNRGSGRGYRRGHRRIAQYYEPQWTNPRGFEQDVFTFARIHYESHRWGPGWDTDWPDSDLNFSFRLQQLTSLKVNPKPVVVELTDQDLGKYPFLYLVEPGSMGLSEAEVSGLREYLLRGGFLMVDDFWGEDEWQNFYTEIKRVFPDREPAELPLEHDIFHCVYDLKDKPQIPSIGFANRARYTGETFERWDAQVPHYKAIFDDKNRMMVLICHNTDLGDGWEREGDNEYYFHEFSEKKAYPLGINIVFYAMTH